METARLHLKILLPHGVFAEVEGVKRIVVETTEGAYGLLPHRLDCTAALVPGILAYETEAAGEAFLAVDEGVMAKAGMEVFVSVRHAVGGAGLGELKEAVEQEFLKLDEQEMALRNTLAKLESDFIRRFMEFHKER